ncbi:MAG: serine/threonine-protein kinase [Chitinophagaceae bacterium]
MLTTAQLNFDILSALGQQGRNSKVYLVHDRQLDAQIVAKQILKTKFKSPTEFFEEAKKLYDSEHQHVVQIKYACEDANHIYLAMPYYKNGSLKNLIDPKFLTVRKIIRYATQFLSGLHNIHVKKLIHFDIKPDNILISDSDEALVSDFGLSSSMNSLGFSGVAAVYPKQIPPEYFTQSHHSMLYDIFDCGLTLYRMCNGNKQYNQQGSLYTTQADYIHAIQSGKFPDRTSYLPHIPKSLRKVINKSIEVDQSKRHQTVLEMMNDLAGINDLLDWQYSENLGTSQWELDLDDKIFSVTLTSSGSLFDINTNKTMKNSGNTTKVHALCKTGLVLKDVEKTVSQFLLAAT